MMAQSTTKTQVLVESDVRQKILCLDGALESLLNGGEIDLPDTPGRDVQIVEVRQLPDKKGLASREGQARLLHDLASIELQAMELCVRTLIEFPEAPSAFREQLAEVGRDEGRHLGLCLKAMDDLEMPWGSFPTHIGLWHCVDRGDSLLDRILIVHRYLEGSGLDASGTLLRRLSGVRAAEAVSAVEVIRRDEVGHVQFGSRWYHDLVRKEGLDPRADFEIRMGRLIKKVPRRLEPIERGMRKTVGFSDEEIDILESHRQNWLAPRV